MNDRLPSKEKAIKLLVQSGCSPEVVSHCEAVAKVAKEIAEACKRKGLGIDTELVEVSALLHDIGRSKTHSVHHARKGVEIARLLELPNSVVSIIERHVGGGIIRQEAEKLGWPVKDYSPQTLEEKIVSYADLLIEDAKKVSFERVIERFSKKLPQSSVQRMKRLHEEISTFIGDSDACRDAS